MVISNTIDYYFIQIQWKDKYPIHNYDAFAAQLFSQSVAAGVQTYLALGKLPLKI